MEEEEKRPKKKSVIKSHDYMGAASSPTGGRGKPLRRPIDHSRGSPLTRFDLKVLIGVLRKELKSVSL